MELVNMTCADTAVDLTSVEGLPTQKGAIVTAKLTLAIGRDGSVSLVSDDPLPLLREDEIGATGILPRDMGGFAHEGVELIVNGAAHAPNGRATSQMEVSLQVGDDVHRAVVSGDRVWVGHGEDAVPTEPIPFLRMPLGYERAFGGSARVWLDEHTAVAVSHLANPLGRGFDPATMTGALVEALGCPPTFPRLDYTRALPNVEDPSERVVRWSDAPRPCSWAARPAEIAGAVRITEHPQDGAPPPWIEELAQAQRVRCHPDLVLSRPLAGIAIVLRGFTPDGVLGFYFPPVGVMVDVELDGREVERALALRRVVLLPDERRVAATFETKFRFEAREDGRRSLRVRLSEGHRA